MANLLDEADREVLPLVESDEAFVALLLRLLEAREAAEREEAAVHRLFGLVAAGHCQLGLS